MSKKKEKRRQGIIKLARNEYQREGEVEIDDNAKLSETDSMAEGGENGCYVQAWVWVSFEATPFDKENAA